MLSKAVLSEPGYTPKVRDLATVLKWLLDADDATAELAERALINADEAVIDLALGELERASGLQRVRLVRLLGRLTQRTGAVRVAEALVRQLKDDQPKVVRAAIVALGKLPLQLAQRTGAEATIVNGLSLWADAERRAAIEALGKIGGVVAVRALAADAPRSDLERPLFERARLRLQRACTVLDDSDTVLLDVELVQPFALAVLHRSGLSEIVARQLGELGPGVADGPERRILHDYTGSLGAVFRARSMLAPALMLHFQRPRAESDWAHQITEAITRPVVVEALTRLSSTRPRLRFSLPKEGHQRALLWAISEKVASASDRLEVNPKGALWEIYVDRTGEPSLMVVPKRFEDPRYPYRVREISGASHPSIAAALVHLLEVRESDVIWDPFVGSALELIECAYQGRYHELIGSDNNVRSLEAASANVNAAKLDRVRLLNADARTARFRGVTGIVTNPPLGVRHQRDGQLEPLLIDFLVNARQNLVPEGRLVWLSALPQKTAECAARLGFEIRRFGPVDVGGLSPELQLFRAPAKSAKRWRS